MVNTFIPVDNFEEIAKILDNKRLGKQRVEAMQIINILSGKSKSAAWKNHTAVKMWEGHVDALKVYYNAIVKEWIRRGFNNTMKLYKVKKNVVLPWFVTNKIVNLSHQANLLRKDKAYYSKFFKKVPAKYIKYTYIWPSRLTKLQIEELKKTKSIPDIELYTILHKL
jgi:hypothetical protein